MSAIRREERFLDEIEMEGTGMLIHCYEEFLHKMSDWQFHSHVLYFLLAGKKFVILLA